MMGVLKRGGRTRLVLFAVVVAVLFVSAAAVGRAVGPIDRSSEASSEGHAAVESGEHAGEPASAADGLAVASGDVRLAVAMTALESGTAQRLAFQILGADRAVGDFDLLHERRMHLIVVRRDLTGFQHVHPELGADGTWVADLAPLEPGTYRAFADFSTGGARTVLGADLFVPGAAASEALPPPAATAQVGEYRVELESGELVAGEPSLLSFTIADESGPVEPEPYLGARGHLVVLREGDLGYLHTHPEDDNAETIRMETTFPSAGRYRAFLQFVVDGVVRTAAFTVGVQP